MESVSVTIDQLAERLEPLNQTLFSAHLIADVLSRLLERNPSEGETRLEELRQLTFQALSEMGLILNDLNALRDRMVDDNAEESINGNGSTTDSSLTGR